MGWVGSWMYREEADPWSTRPLPQPALGRSGYRVLLIEDDEAMRRMIAATLRRDGHAVIEAADGDEAFDWLGAGIVDGNAAYVPDLVVSDIRLPYFDGLEILECLQVATRRIPVILMTGFPDGHTAARAHELGAECLLEKPFELGELRAAVHVALRHRGPVLGLRR